MKTEQHLEWWNTAWYVNEAGSIRAQIGAEPSDSDPYIFVADANRMLPLEVAETVVAWWNADHAAPDAPITDEGPGPDDAWEP